ncbi:MAG: DnaB helicase C-terminal domain-containing protein [Candidatus Marinimicrobia bacterium]|jgi:replicative DNA helicase|nr:DnaB helicase C-terminal domain-containing protein [Candidatus Neomarinimicrobiota bacterium]
MTKEIPVKEIEGIKNPIPTSEMLQGYIDMLGDGKRDLIGIKTGEVSIDRALLGLSGVIVLGGQAGGGKTTLAIHLAKQVAQNGTPVLFYSLEMPRVAILTKLLSSLSQVGYGDILLSGKTAFNDEDSRLTPNSKEAIRDGKEELEKFADLLYIKTRDKEDGEVTFSTATADIEYLKKKHKTDNVFVIVDHLQVFTPSTAVRDQIQKEQDLINGFKGININTNATVLLISQQNKASYNNTTVTSIKGSVDIIYLADVVMFVKKQDEDEEIAEAFSDGETDIEIVIDKNRYNAPRTIKGKMTAKYSLMKFEE